MVVVGLLVVELAIGEGSSLKDKRRIIKSMLESIRARFNISASEVGRLDSHRASELAFTVVTNDRRFANSVLDNVLRVVESDPRIDIVDTALEFL